VLFRSVCGSSHTLTLLVPIHDALVEVDESIPHEDLNLHQPPQSVFLYTTCVAFVSWHALDVFFEISWNSTVSSLKPRCSRRPGDGTGPTKADRSSGAHPKHGGDCIQYGTTLKRDIACEPLEIVRNVH
jgi:hypothetical protein